MCVGHRKLAAGVQSTGQESTSHCAGFHFIFLLSSFDPHPDLLLYLESQSPVTFSFSREWTGRWLPIEGLRNRGKSLCVQTLLPLSLASCLVPATSAPWAFLGLWCDWATLSSISPYADSMFAVFFICKVIYQSSIFCLAKIYCPSCLIWCSLCSSGFMLLKKLFAVILVWFWTRREKTPHILILYV